MVSSQTCVDENNFISTIETVYRFKVNYIKTKDLTHGECITSPTFKSEGYKWIICCYPNGSGKHKDKDNIGVFLELRSDYIDLHASFTLSIMDKSGTEAFQRKFNGKFSVESNRGSHCFIRRTILEQGYLSEDGYFQILCSINVMPQIRIGGVKEDISALWENGEMTDVNFEVDGEIISAHRVILAARSPVFRAELFGHMVEAKKIECIKIEDMKPEVFRALLRFIYDNSLDNARDTDQATSVMTQHILAAADRYAVEGLIARCKKYLMNNLSFDTVMDVLTLSEQHNFIKLKEACLEFASRQENFTKVAFTNGYIQMAQVYPSLWEELRKKATHVSTD
ncbi:BTB/POZ and MATH domain-containing protein 2-like [Carex rostrata]